jgi:hypothetical protein
MKISAAGDHLYAFGASGSGARSDPPVSCTSTSVGVVCLPLKQRTEEMSVMRSRVVGVGCVILVAGAVATSASADVTCDPTGCAAAVTGAPGGVPVGAVASVGSGQAAGGAVALTPPAGGVAGPGVAAAGASVGQPTGATEIVNTQVGQYGAAGDLATASVGQNGATALAAAQQNNLGNAVNASAGVNSTDPTTSGAGGACAREPQGGACGIAGASAGPEGTTATAVTFAGTPVGAPPPACVTASQPPGAPTTLSATC